MLSIHINLSAGAQNIIAAYIIIMLVCRHLLTMCLLGQSHGQYILSIELQTNYCYAT